jgi:hypothetical protein
VVMQTTPETIPDSVPYVTLDPARVAKWKDKLPDDGIMRAAVAWGGNPAHGNDRKRSMNLDTLAPLFKTPGWRFYVVQRDISARDAKVLADYDNVVNLSDALVDFDETAAILTRMHRVVTVDTALGHLAGAMGAETWTMLPFAPDWRWGLGLDESAWYPTVKLFRQTEPGDWASIIAKIQGVWGLTAPTLLL